MDIGLKWFKEKEKAAKPYSSCLTWHLSVVRLRGLLFALAWKTDCTPAASLPDSPNALGLEVPLCLGEHVPYTRP